MGTYVCNSYELIAGHYLPRVPEGHKCRRPHGHNYKIEVYASGPVMENGFIVDFYDIDRIMMPLIEQLDHTMLNEHEGLENPTAEIISHWFLSRLREITPLIYAVKVWETPSCWALSTWAPGGFPAADR